MTELVKLLKSSNYTLDNIQDIRKKVYRDYVKINVDPEKGSNDTQRVLFSVVKSNSRSNRGTKISWECNGLILEAPSWRPLVIPTPTPHTYLSSKNFNSNDYDIYKIELGTVINIYYWNGQWRISTSRGYDMGNVKFNKNTFYEMINDALGEQFNVDWAQFTDTLDTTYSYTFILQHNNLQRIKGKYELANMIFVHSICLTESYDEYYNHLIRVNNTKFDFPNQRIVSRIDKESLKDSISDYIKGREPFYGYMLYRKTYKDTLNTAIMLESNLLKKIRYLIYDLFNSSYGEKQDIYITIYAYFGDYYDKKLFITLYPECQKYYNILDTICKDLPAKVLDAVNEVQKNNIFVEGKLDKYEDDLNPYHYLAHKVLQYHSPSSLTIETIQNVILSSDYVDVYMTLILSASQK